MTHLSVNGKCTRTAIHQQAAPTVANKTIDKRKRNRKNLKEKITHQVCTTLGSLKLNPDEFKKLIPNLFRNILKQVLAYRIEFSMEQFEADEISLGIILRVIYDFDSSGADSVEKIDSQIKSFISQARVKRKQFVLNQLKHLSLPQRQLLVLVLLGKKVPDITRILDLSIEEIHDIHKNALERIPARWHGPFNLQENSPKSNVEISPKTKRLEIIVDSNVDKEMFAKFLNELSQFYSELSGGDELVILEGKIPEATGVLV